MGGSASSTVATIRDARRDLYRQQILAAAELEFSKSGFADTKMSAIAASADLSLATIYKHFAGKAEIWDDLHTDRMQALLAEVEEGSREAPTSVERLIAGIVAVARYLTEHDAYLEMSIRAGAGWASSTEHAVGVQKSVWSAGLDMITEGLESAAAKGELSDVRPTIAAGLVVSSLQIWLIDWVDSGRDRSPAIVTEELAQHLRRMLTGDA